MKHIFIILIALLTGCISSNKSINDKVENELNELLKQQKDCDYRFSIMKVASYTDSSHHQLIQTPEVTYISDPSSSWGESPVVKYCFSNRKEVYPILIKMLSGDKYEWTCNLLLYDITEEPADNLAKYAPDKCEEWKSERKQKDIVFWKNHKPLN